MSDAVDIYTLKAATVVIDAMTALDKALTESQTGDLFLDGTLLLKIDVDVVGHIAYQDGLWAFFSGAPS